MPDSGAHCYEQPLNERIRTFLRLEHLLMRLRYHENDDSLCGRRAAMTTLIDILTVMSRHDLRTEVSKTLGASYARLDPFRQRDDVDTDQLQQLLDRIDSHGRALQHVPPHFASYQLRDDGLLNSLNNRHAIPGGTCAFDIPSYRCWLHRPTEDIRRDIKHWCRHVVPFENAIKTLLGLMRESTPMQSRQATEGVYIHQTEPGTQLIRVTPEDDRIYPEISAGRHRTTIRFMTFHGHDLQVRQCHSPISFRMACCRS